MRLSPHAQRGAQLIDRSISRTTTNPNINILQIMSTVRLSLLATRSVLTVSLISPCSWGNHCAVPRSVTMQTRQIMPSKLLQCLLIIITTALASLRLEIIWFTSDSVETHDVNIQSSIHILNELMEEKETIVVGSLKIAQVRDRNATLRKTSNPVVVKCQMSYVKRE